MKVSIHLCLAIGMAVTFSLWETKGNPLPEKDAHKTGKTPVVLTIQRMFELAEENSRQLKVAQAALESAQYAVKESQNSLMPDIKTNVSGSYIGNGYMIDRSFSTTQKVPMPHWGNNFSIQVFQVLYAGGSLMKQIDIAKLNAQGAEWELNRNRQQIRFILIGHYLDLYQQINLISVYDSNICQTSQVIDQMCEKEKQGVVLKNDITRYELLLANLKLDRKKLENALQITNNQLLSILGLPDSLWIFPDTNLLENFKPDTHIAWNEGKWMESTLANRPSLHQQKLKTKVLQKQQEIIRSQRRPQIMLQAANQFDGPILIEVPTINKNFNYWYVGIGLQYNISSLYKTPRSLRRNQANIEQSEYQYLQGEDEAILETKADYILYQQSFDEYSTGRKNLELAKENYEIIHRRYLNEMALITDMLDASNSKLDAETQLTNARINIIYTYFKLCYSAGII